MRGVTQSVNVRVSSASGLCKYAHRFSIRRKTFSGFCPFDLYRSGDAESFGSQVNLSGTIREERVTDSASDGTEAGRACLRVTVRTSDGGGGFGEGSTRSEKDRGGFTSSTLKRRRSVVCRFAIARS